MEKVMVLAEHKDVDVPTDTKNHQMISVFGPADEFFTSEWAVCELADFKVILTEQKVFKFLNMEIFQ
jgi:hypothetical protein